MPTLTELDPKVRAEECDSQRKAKSATKLAFLCPKTLSIPLFFNKISGLYPVVWWSCGVVIDVARVLACGLRKSLPS